MPVDFLEHQHDSYGSYCQPPTSQDLSRCFHLDDLDLELISEKRGAHNRLGFALQLSTLRYLGLFIKQPFDVPDVVIETLQEQLNLHEKVDYQRYLNGSQRWHHIQQIRDYYGYTDLSEGRIVFYFCRWLYALCWSGIDRPKVLFEKAQYWLIAHKVILPGRSTLERFISKLRARVDKRIWRILVSDLTLEQQEQLLELLLPQPNQRLSILEKLRTSPVSASSKTINKEIQRLIDVRKYHFPWQFKKNIPIVRIKLLSRYASTAKVAALRRMSHLKKLAILRALMASLEASIQDDILVIFESIIQEIFNNADRTYKQNRQRNLKDMDDAALQLAKLGQLVLDDTVPESELRAAIFAQLSPQQISGAVSKVTELTRPHDKVFFQELDEKYRTLRIFLPKLLAQVQFQGHAGAKQVLEALDWMSSNMVRGKVKGSAPLESVSKRWMPLVMGKDGQTFNFHAYTFSTVDNALKALKRRDIFIEPSWRYADPQKDLLTGDEWHQSKPMICRALGISMDPATTIQNLVSELDCTYRAVAQRFHSNPDITIEDERLKLTPLEKDEEPPSLEHLRKLFSKRLPRIELPELILEVANRTHFTEALTHISEKSARADDIDISLCAVLLAEACNTGFEPLIQPDVRALKRDRLSWVSQNYIRDETITKANAILVNAYNELPIVKSWGDGTMAAADGLRFIVAVKTLYAGPNPKYFPQKKGLTWNNLLSDKLIGLNDIPVPGTLKDSLSLLALVLEQQTEIQPSEIMTDTGSYSDVVFGLFRLLGYRFSPRLADLGGQRLWRVDPEADYGELNAVSTNRIRLNKITPQWEDVLRFIGSLQLGKLSARDAMRVLQSGSNQSSLARAIAEIGRIDKTIHLLTYIDDIEKRRMILKQLNRVEGRHNLAREVFHGRRGEMRQKYREGQEDQLGALGLMLNVIVYWNALYMQQVVDQLQQEGMNINSDDLTRALPLLFSHINMNGKYTFTIPKEVKNGDLRPLRDVAQDTDEPLS